MKHELTANHNGHWEPEREIPEFIRQAFEANQELDSMEVMIGEQEGHWVVHRGSVKPAMDLLKMDTSYMNHSMIFKARDVAEDLREEKAEPEDAVNQLGDLIVALVFEMYAFHEPNSTSPLDVVGAIADNVEALVTTKQALEATT